MKSEVVEICRGRYFCDDITEEHKLVFVSCVHITAWSCIAYMIESHNFVVVCRFSSLMETISYIKRLMVANLFGFEYVTFNFISIPLNTSWFRPFAFLSIYRATPYARVLVLFPLRTTWRNIVICPCRCLFRVIEEAKKNRGKECKVAAVAWCDRRQKDSVRDTSFWFVLIYFLWSSATYK